MPALKHRILDALIAFEEAKPRNQQVRLGPSELGGCREYVRNVMIGTPQQESHVWPVAAVMGTLAGAYVEKVCEEYLGALTEVPVTTTLPNGLRVSGHADVVLVEDNAVVDVKTKNELHEVLKEGASLDNAIQVSVYTYGLVQAGVLSEGATAHLIYVDRSGMQQFLHEIEFTWEQILGYLDLCVERLDSVLEAQEHVDQGEVEWARSLRDKTPPFCYSERVMCPFRDLCWKGSEWMPDEEITDPEVIENVRRYAENREASRAAESIRKELREKLVGVKGVTPDGFSVYWSGDAARAALYVTKVKEKR